MISKNMYWFTSVLKSTDNIILATGKSCVSPEYKSVDFCSDFVPLYPIDTPMQICRIEKDQEIHRFWGKVYISDKKLMRIVSADDELLPGSEYIYCQDMPFTATLLMQQKPKGLAILRRKLHEDKSTWEKIRVKIVEITDEKLVFLLDNEREFEENQRFVIQADLPLVLPEVTVELVRSLSFGSGGSHLCRFVDIPLLELEALRTFLWEHNCANNKIF